MSNLQIYSLFNSLVLEGNRCMKGKHKNYKEVMPTTFNGIYIRGATKYRLERVCHETNP